MDWKRTRRASRVLAALLTMLAVLAGLALVQSAAPASAQQGDPCPPDEPPGGPPDGRPCDPYGSTSTTRPQGKPRATIRLTSNVGPDDIDVGVFACGYIPGETGGSVTFDGRVVASPLTANADGCLERQGGGGRSALLAAKLAARQQSEAPLTIHIPDGASPGRHQVCSVMAGYNTPCANYRVQGEGAGETPRGLAFSGIEVALLIAAALALLVGGAAAVTAARRRRQAAAARARRTRVPADR